MKTKILEKLKVACKDLTSVSEQTLEVFATQMAATVTEESGIDAAIQGQMPILNALQGNINFTASRAVNDYKEKNPVPNPIPAPNPTPTPNPTPEPTQAPTLDVAAIAKMISDGIAQGLAPINQAKQREQLISDAKKAISEKFSLEESEIKQSDYIFNQIVSGEIKDVDSVVKNYEEKYNEFRSILGQGAVAPKQAISGSEPSSDEDPYVKKIREERAAKAARDKAVNDRINGIN